MLAANEAVAERLHRADAPALPHPRAPDRASRGVLRPGRPSGIGAANLEQIRPEDFQLVLRQIEGKPEQKLVSYLLLRTMKLARYHEANLGHFGLATEMYAHFTSPIRRYPDLVVHRALRALRLGGGADQAGLREALPEMGRHLSEMERRATEAEREPPSGEGRFMATSSARPSRGSDGSAGIRAVRRAG
jgi:ribonuclease R